MCSGQSLVVFVVFGCDTRAITFGPMQSARSRCLFQTSALVHILLVCLVWSDPKSPLYRVPRTCQVWAEHIFIGEKKTQIGMEWEIFFLYTFDQNAKDLRKQLRFGNSMLSVNQTILSCGKLHFFILFLAKGILSQADKSLCFCKC